MSYLDSGFNTFLYRNMPSAPNETEYETSVQTPALTGTSIAGGIMESRDKKMQIDFATGKILIGDGANWRILMGEDGL